MESVTNHIPPDYQAYLKRGGTKSLEAYDMLKCEADAYIRQYTFNRYPENVAVDDMRIRCAIDEATSAIVDILSAHDLHDQTISSKSNNGISVSFRQDVSLEKVIRSTVLRHLGHLKDRSGVPLCYAGVD